jgi:hypothetical protein
MTAPPKPCPFCGSTETHQAATFSTSLMVALHYCRACHTSFEAIKWGDRDAALEVPRFLDEPAPPT